MKKNKGEVIETMGEASGFVDFLKKEFTATAKQGARRSVSHFAEERNVSGARKKNSQKILPSKGTYSAKNKVSSELAFASKLTKTVEVFLKDENSGKKAFRNTFSADWEKEYDNRQAELLKSARDLILPKKRKAEERKSQLYEYFKVLEDSKVRWTAVVLLLLNISIYVTLFHPGPAKLIVASLERPIKESIIRLASSLKYSDHQDGAVTERAVADNSPKRVLDKNRLSDFIKKNSGSIKEDMVVTEEDLNGQVAGVSEEK